MAPMGSHVLKRVVQAAAEPGVCWIPIPDLCEQSDFIQGCLTVVLCTLLDLQGIQVWELCNAALMLTRLACTAYAKSYAQHASQQVVQSSAPAFWSRAEWACMLCHTACNTSAPLAGALTLGLHLSSIVPSSMALNQAVAMLHQMVPEDLLP